MTTDTTTPHRPRRARSIPSRCERQLLAAAAFIAAAAACSGCAERPAGAAADAPQAEKLVAVQVVAPEPTELARTTTQPATIHAFHEAEISAKAAGYLAELNVDIGQTVKAGEVLAVVAVPELEKQRLAKMAAVERLKADEKRAAAEMSVAEANLASYEALLDKAKADVGETEAFVSASRTELDRISDLVERKAVADRLRDESQSKYEASQAQQAAATAAVAAAAAQVALSRAQAAAAQADIDVAKAQTDVAQRELEEFDELLKYAQLTAPFDGVVTQRNIDPGDLVRDSQNGGGHRAPLFVITKLDKVRVRVAIPERDAPLADVGDEAAITFQALPGKTYSGKVARRAGVLDEQTRTMLVEIDLPNPDGELLPGMFGQATITLAPANENLMLPAGAVRYDEKGASYLYVVGAGDKVEVVEVATGLDDGQRIEITSGLNGGERVVGPLLRRLKAGQQVKVDG